MLKTYRQYLSANKLSITKQDMHVSSLALAVYSHDNEAGRRGAFAGVNAPRICGRFNNKRRLRQPKGYAAQPSVHGRKAKNAAGIFNGVQYTIS